MKTCHIGNRMQLLTLLILVLTSVCMSVPAAAQLDESGVLTMPVSTRTIQAYAFSGNTGISRVILPDGLLSIGAYAFDGCDNLANVYIPSTVELIGDGAFPQGTVIQCDDGSYAEEWIEANGYTRAREYYALLIGQEYTGQEEYIPGCFRDVDSMASMIQSMEKTDYQITVCKDITASGILSAVASAFSKAKDNDVCLFYYAGHGNYSQDQTDLGALVGTDLNHVTMERLKTELDKLTADKIIILDSCYSGAAIESPTTYAMDDSAQTPLEKINGSIVSAFSAKPRSALAAGDYYVMTAARWDEISASVGTVVDGTVICFGAFTYGVLYGSGYDEIAAAQFGSMPADQNADGTISLAESYDHAYACALTYNSMQHAQSYPTGSEYTIWAK